MIYQNIQAIDWIQPTAYSERRVEITSPVTGGNVGGDERLSTYELLYRITGWKQAWYAFNVMEFRCEAENKLSIVLERQQKLRNKFISFSKHVKKTMLISTVKCKHNKFDDTKSVTVNIQSSSAYGVPASQIS